MIMKQAYGELMIGICFESVKTAFSYLANDYIDDLRVWINKQFKRKGK